MKLDLLVKTNAKTDSETPRHAVPKDAQPWKIQYRQLNSTTLKTPDGPNSDLKGPQNEPQIGDIVFRTDKNHKKIFNLREPEYLDPKYKAITAPFG